MGCDCGCGCCGPEKIEYHPIGVTLALQVLGHDLAEHFPSRDLICKNADCHMELTVEESKGVDLVKLPKCPVTREMYYRDWVRECFES